MQKKFLSIDYGEKFVGIATFHQGFDPYPLKWGRIANRGDALLCKELKSLFMQEEITDVICGIPYFTDGKESKNTLKIKKFFSYLQTYCGDQWKYYEQDETLTSNEAKDRMLNSPEFNFKVDINQIDALSAQIILEDFLRNP